MHIVTYSERAPPGSAPDCSQTKIIIERTVVYCVYIGRVEMQIEIGKGWCTADTDSKV